MCLVFWFTIILSWTVVCNFELCIPSLEGYFCLSWLLNSCHCVRLLQAWEDWVNQSSCKLYITECCRDCFLLLWPWKNKSWKIIKIIVLTYSCKLVYSACKITCDGFFHICHFNTKLMVTFIIVPKNIEEPKWIIEDVTIPRSTCIKIWKYNIKNKQNNWIPFLHKISRFLLSSIRIIMSDIYKWGMHLV